MYEGEKITYFITEKTVAGEMISTPSVTRQKEACMLDSGTSYGRMNEMRQLLEAGKEDALFNEMQEYRFLEMACEQLFPLE
jgi:hypothetical protein